MIHKIRNILIILVFEVIFTNSGFGLKSAINSLSITPDLSPGLFRRMDNRALAPNSSLFIIPDTHFN